MFVLSEVGDLPGDRDGCRLLGGEIEVGLQRSLGAEPGAGRRVARHVTEQHRIVEAPADALGGIAGVQRDSSGKCGDLGGRRAGSKTGERPQPGRLQIVIQRTARFHEHARRRRNHHRVNAVVGVVALRTAGQRHARPGGPRAENRRNAWRGEHRSVGTDERQHVDRCLLDDVGARVPGDERRTEVEERDLRSVEVACGWRADAGGRPGDRRQNDVARHEGHRPPFALRERVAAVEDLLDGSQRARRSVGGDLRVDDLQKRAVESARRSDAEDRPADTLDRVTGAAADHRHVDRLHPDFRVIGPDLGGQEGDPSRCWPRRCANRGSTNHRRLQDEVERNAARQPVVRRQWPCSARRAAGVKRLDVEQREELGRGRRRRLRAATERDQRRAAQRL